MAEDDYQCKDCYKSDGAGMPCSNLDACRLMDQQKPCPFCGEQLAIELQLVDIEQREGQLVCMTCNKCGASGPTDYSKDERTHQAIALAEWNKRPIEKELVNYRIEIYRNDRLMSSTSPRNDIDQLDKIKRIKEYIDDLLR